MTKGGLGLGRHYKGALAVPIDVADATEAHCKSEFSRRFDLLFREYGLQPGEWEDLAFALAVHHVPGFQIAYVEPPGRTGRPGRWTPAEIRALADTVEHVMTVAHGDPLQAKRRTISGACAYIARSGAFPQYTTPAGRDHRTWAQSLAKHVSSARQLRVEAAPGTDHAIPEKPFAKPLVGSISRKP